jgi:hypothetical protein
MVQAFTATLDPGEFQDGLPIWQARQLILSGESRYTSKTPQAPHCDMISRYLDPRVFT